MSKEAFFAQRVTTNRVGVVTTEDLAFWKSKGIEPKESVGLLGGNLDLVVLGEVLQKSGEPEKVLAQAKKMAPKLLVTVPYEYNWDAKFAPFKNPAHKRFYDADMLAEQLDEAGFLYVLRQIDFAGWSWLAAEATA